MRLSPEARERMLVIVLMILWTTTPLVVMGMALILALFLFGQ